MLLLLLLLQDYRLNWRLNTACTSDIKRLCGGLCDTSSGQPCGGVVLQCLQVSAALRRPLNVQ
jgi:Golgi apparatus protein 1